MSVEVNKRAQIRSNYEDARGAIGSLAFVETFSVEEAKSFSNKFAKLNIKRNIIGLDNFAEGFLTTDERILNSRRRELRGWKLALKDTERGSWDKMTEMLRQERDKNENADSHALMIGLNTILAYLPQEN